ncbi:MAG TPA: PaaI family thioesterase [Acidimicrobiales bacterium]
MALRPLTNEGWGFSSNCFVCEPANASGLRIPFFHDDEAGTVVADFRLGPEFSGAPTYVHGGVVLAVLDEAQAWATIAVGGRFAVTTETTTRFLRPARVGRDYRVEARLTATHGDDLATAATVSDERGRPCAESTATFRALSAAAAVDAIGSDISGTPDADYLRD